MNTIATCIKKQILKDINNGVFSYPDTTTIEYYGDNDSIEVRADVGNYYDILDFAVIITDENGEEYICEEQRSELAEALEMSLRDAKEEAKSEAAHTRYLWNSCA